MEAVLLWDGQQLLQSDEFQLVEAGCPENSATLSIISLSELPIIVKPDHSQDDEESAATVDQCEDELDLAPSVSDPAPSVSDPAPSVSDPTSSGSDLMPSGSEITPSVSDKKILLELTNGCIVVLPADEGADIGAQYRVLPGVDDGAAFTSLMHKSVAVDSMSSDVTKAWFTSKCEKNAYLNTGQQWKQGQWTKEEVDCLQNNINSYCQDHSLTDPTELIFDMTKDERKDFYRTIAVGIQRPLFSIYRRVIRMYDRKNYIGKYSQDDLAKLKELRERHGSDWAKIGSQLGRSASSVKDRCRLINDTCNTGKWCSEEEQKLSDAVHSLTGSTTDTDVTSGLCWTRVAEHVGTRSEKQCRTKWLNYLNWKQRGGTEWTKRDDQLLIDRLKSSEVTDEVDVNWNDIAKNWPSVRSPQWLRGKWWSIKRHVPQYNATPFKDLLESLHRTRADSLEYDPTRTRTGSESLRARMGSDHLEIKTGSNYLIRTRTDQSRHGTRSNLSGRVRNGSDPHRLDSSTHLSVSRGTTEYTRLELDQQITGHISGHIVGHIGGQLCATSQENCPSIDSGQIIDVNDAALISYSGVPSSCEASDISFQVIHDFDQSEGVYLIEDSQSESLYLSAPPTQSGHSYLLTDSSNHDGDTYALDGVENGSEVMRLIECSAEQETVCDVSLGHDTVELAEEDHAVCQVDPDFVSLTSHDLVTLVSQFSRSVSNDGDVLINKTDPLLASQNTDD